MSQAFDQSPTNVRYQFKSMISNFHTFCINECTCMFYMQVSPINLDCTNKFALEPGDLPRKFSKGTEF